MYHPKIAHFDIDFKNINLLEITKFPNNEFRIILFMIWKVQQSHIDKRHKPKFDFEEISKKCGIYYRSVAPLLRKLKREKLIYRSMIDSIKGKEYHLELPEGFKYSQDNFLKFLEKSGNTVVERAKRSLLSGVYQVSQMLNASHRTLSKTTTKSQKSNSN